MSAQAVRFATAVLAAFEAAGAVTDVEVAQAGGPSSTTMTKLRKAALGELEMAEPRNDTYRRIEAVAGWKAGAARALWRDGVRPLPERGGLEALGFKRQRVPPSGLDGYIQELADRILELEERVDLLEASRPVSGRGQIRKGNSQLDVVGRDSQTSGLSFVEVKRLGGGGTGAVEWDATSKQVRAYVIALAEVAEEPEVAAALNERLVLQQRVDEELAKEARHLIWAAAGSGKTEALLQAAIAAQASGDQFEPFDLRLSDEDREFLDESRVEAPALPKAARKAQSRGRALRRHQDEDAEANQDDRDLGDPSRFLEPEPTAEPGTGGDQ